MTKSREKFDAATLQNAPHNQSAKQGDRDAHFEEGNSTMKRRYYTGTDVNKALSVEDLRRMAERRLPAFAFEFLESGGEDGSLSRRGTAESSARFASSRALWSTPAPVASARGSSAASCPRH